MAKANDITNNQIRAAQKQKTKRVKKKSKKETTNLNYTQFTSFSLSRKNNQSKTNVLFPPISKRYATPKASMKTKNSKQTHKKALKSIDAIDNP